MARIVFDLDGTLIDSAPDLRGNANRILAAENLPPVSLEQTHSFIGHGSAVFVKRLRAARSIPDSEQQRLLEAFLQGYDTAVSLTTPYPEVREVLERLGASGHRLGICTNKPHSAAETVLRHLGLDHHFAVVLGGDSLPERKPDPAPLHMTLSRLGAGPALFVGDSETDAETARRAGIPFLLFTEGYRNTPAEDLPHAARFSGFAALPAIIDRFLATVP